MADDRLTPQTLTSTTTTVTRNAMSTANTHQVLNSPGGTILNFEKSGAGEATVTITTPGTVDGLAIADRTVTVPASTGDVAVWLPYANYTNGSGDIEFTTDEDTGLTVAVFQT